MVAIPLAVAVCILGNSRGHRKDNILSRQDALFSPRNDRSPGRIEGHLQWSALPVPLVKTWGRVAFSCLHLPLCCWLVPHAPVGDLCAHFISELPQAFLLGAGGT